MLTQATDYRYCTPIAAGIKGSVLPMVDGTAAARVNRYEDVAFLVEAVRERCDWDFGRPGGSTQWLDWMVPGYDGSCVAVRDDFADLVKHLSNGWRPLGTAGDTGYDYSMASENWDNGLSGSSFPVISIPDPGEILPAQSSLDLLFANAAIARDSASIATVPRIAEGDTLRAMYSDIAKMKRFVFNEELNPLHNVPFDDATFNERPESWMVALQTDNRSTLDTPRLTWFESSGTYYTNLPGTLTFYIRKPFAVNALTQARYYSMGTAYPVFHLTYTVKDSQGTWHVFETSAIFRIVNVSVAPVSTANFEGSFTIEMSSGRMEGYIGLIMQKLRQSSLVQGSVQSVGISFSNICFDTGSIALPSTVPQ